MDFSEHSVEKSSLTVNCPSSIVNCKKEGSEDLVGRVIILHYITKVKIWRMIIVEETKKN